MCSPPPPAVKGWFIELALRVQFSMLTAPFVLWTEIPVPLECVRATCHIFTLVQLKMYKAELRNEVIFDSTSHLSCCTPQYRIVTDTIVRFWTQTKDKPASGVSQSITIPILRFAGVRVRSLNWTNWTCDVMFSWGPWASILSGLFCNCLELLAMNARDLHMWSEEFEIKHVSLSHPSVPSM